MKRTTIVGLIGIFVLAVAVGFVLGSYFGLIGSTVSAYPNSTELPSDDFTDVADMINMDFDDYETAVDELNIRIYGVNGDSANDVISWYSYQNEKDGWEILASDHDSGSNWDGYLYAWSKVLQGRAVIAVDGSIVETLTEYDTIVLTSHAPLSVYERYFEMD